MNAPTQLNMAKEYAHAGMCDWLTLMIERRRLPSEAIDAFHAISSRVIKIDPEGCKVFENTCFESIKSDDNHITIKLSPEHVLIQGSPARVGLPNNMFGSLDLRHCAQKMIQFIARHLGLGRMPLYFYWQCTRIDITRNLLMTSESEARQALAQLKQTPEGRQRHSTESNGLYIGKNSTLIAGKIYLKGQDARRNQKKGTAQYTDIELRKADKILRAELKLGRHYMRRLLDEHGTHWYQLTPDKLLQIHTDYFKPYFSDIEFVDMTDILEKLIAVADTEGQARAAYDCYNRCKTYGYEQAKSSYTKPTWYRHTKHLRNAGLTRADLNLANVVPLKKRRIEVGDAVRHWDDISIAS